MQKNDLGNSFAKLIDGNFIRVDGSLVQKGPNPNTGEEGLIYQGVWYKNIDEVKDAMRGIYDLISLAIVNPNGDTTKLSQRYTECYHKGESGYKKFKEDQK